MKQAFLDRYLKCIVLAASLVSLGYGVWSGEMRTVMRKAIAICMECIGIG